eukprot:EG_transcript_20886
MSKAAPSLRIPKPILVGTLTSGSAFIVMDYIDQKGRSGTDVQKRLGKGVAEMHLAPAEHPTFGFPMDGCCGAAPQPNNVDRRPLDWVDFWREFRLGHQLQMAKDNYPHNRALQEAGAQLMKRLPELFSMIHVEDIQPSLLHGDLWSGNYSVDETGCPCIFDPACYYGHHEADHGIAHMFGGFSAEFFSAYHEAIPKEPGYDDRAVLYELHHHLNHYNIFGGGYGSGALDLMRRLNARKHI